MENLKEKALSYHQHPQPGKIAVVPTKPYADPADLSLAYSPGVAYPCKEIKENPAAVRHYTGRSNLVAVISNGTAVLGLGNIGPLAAKPVMEGKALLFKIYAGLDAFDIELDADDPEAFIAAVKAMTPTFGGINLEDIKAPECFEIERRLREECDIPVMHDDQHGTAIVTAAAVINACRLTGKRFEDLHITTFGAGAAAIAIMRLLTAMGVDRDNVVMVDRRGVIHTRRDDLSPYKREFATRRDVSSVDESLRGADVFIGVSKAGLLHPDMIRGMATQPLIMALANPEPEIGMEEALAARPDAIYASGRSDLPNQVNNLLAFPYVFRGALDVRARRIDTPMKIAAAETLARLARHTPTQDEHRSGCEPAFCRERLLPTPFDERLRHAVPHAVAEAAVRSGAARADCVPEQTVEAE